MDKSIYVVGIGYVVLPTAFFFANTGCHVYGVAAALRTVETINRGEIPVVEPDLDILVKSAVRLGNWRLARTM